MNTYMTTPTSPPTGKIFCIIGKSSTGKDTIYRSILDRDSLQLRQIVSYTTRPIRAGEVNGREYHFCSLQEEERLDAAGKIIELRRYNTCHGPWDYFTADDEQVDLTQHNYLIIGTVESFVKIREYYGVDVVIPIYIEVEDGLRLMRALNREMSQSQPKYEEMCRRFLADAQDFAADKLEAAGIVKTFQNHNLLETTEEIIEYIKSHLG